MLNISSTFSGFSVAHLDKAKDFYKNILGFEVEDQFGGMYIRTPGGTDTFVYQKDNHAPATYTMLNLVVDDINQAYQDLKQKGVEFEIYPDSHQDENGITWGKKVNMGPNIAWFKDPSGNIISIIEE